MPASYYIHNIYNENISSKFGKEQIKRQLNFQMQQIANISNQMRKEYEEAIGTVPDFNATLLELQERLPQAGQAMVSRLPTINWNAIRQGIAVANVTQNVTMLQKAIAKMREDLQKYESYFDEILKIGMDDLTRPKWFTKADMERIQKLQERLLKAKTELENMDLYSDDKWGISSRLAKVIPPVAGYLSEYAMTDLLNSTFGQMPGVTYTQAGTTRVTGGYNIGTADIAIAITPQEGTVSFSLPGITLKRTATGTGKNPEFNIHIKSSTVGKLIELSQMEAGGFDLETFYNAYANANRKTINFETQSYVVNKVQGMTNMYRAFKTATLATALTGSMNTADFAYYLVINDRVYTAIDIIQAALYGNASIVAATGLKTISSLEEFLNTNQNTTLESAQKYITEQHTALLMKNLTDKDDSIEAENRSAEILNLINNIHLSLNLKLNLTT